MKTILVPLIGDPVQNLYQLGLRERESFFKIERRVTKLLSTNSFLRYGQDILSRARVIMGKKKESGLFDRCIAAYAEGLGIDHVRYLSFLSLFEIAAHYGQIYPELKSILPGCTSVFKKDGDDVTHTRLLDFPLVGIFEENPRLYYWRPEGQASLLTYSCEGLAPLFFQGIHSSGMSFALHHKPGKSWHGDGSSIFQIGFEVLFDSENFGDFKKNLKKKISMTKWAFLLLEKSGQVMAMDIDGPSLNIESYDLNDTSPLIFTNIPLQNVEGGFESFLKFSSDRQSWLKDKLKNIKTEHILDAITDVEDQKLKKWIHPGSTLSTVGAYHVNLHTGLLDLKEGEDTLVSSDKIVRFSLDNQHHMTVLKEKEKIKPFEVAWKRISRAQSSFDQGDYDVAYHELQMANALMPHLVWKEITSFYLYLWDFKFITNHKELSMVYKKVKLLHLPLTLKDQWIFLIMRLEKKLELSYSVSAQDLPPHLKQWFQLEKSAPKPVFATWMKLIYPRLEILDVFSPHHK